MSLPLPILEPAVRAPRGVRNAADVVACRLCTGCGACAGAQPERLAMIDAAGEGRRPVYRDPADAQRDDPITMAICPGIGLAHDAPFPAETSPALRAGWGPVLAVYEAWSTDPEIRFRGSSGGAITALGVAALETLGLHAVAHVAAREDAPLLNRTVLSRTRDELLRGAGSRYAPASPGEALDAIARAPAPCAFVGKPCDVAAAQRLRRLRPDLDARLGLTVSIFCAGTPTTEGTLAMVAAMGIDHPSRVRAVRYRGHGWPGEATVHATHPAGRQTRRLPYETAWGDVLARHVQWRCRLCADHVGEFADVAIGDPWHRPVRPGEPGRSLLVVRTARGQTAVEAAVRAGHLVAERVPDAVLPASQPNLLRGRGAVWGRLLACRLLGAAAPRHRGFPLFRFWWTRLTLTEKVRSVLGTVRRILARRLRRPAALAPLPPEVVGPLPPSVPARRAA